MAKFVFELKKFIIKNYGKKCPDFNPFCAVCIMWHSYEIIKEGTELGELPKKKNK